MAVANVQPTLRNWTFKWPKNARNDQCIEIDNSFSTDEQQKRQLLH